jgi:hypothetical protein
MYAVVTLWIDEGEFGTKIMQSLRFLFMGAWGSALYYILLRLFLFLQGKELGTYQGINGMSEGVTAQSGGFLHRIAMCYRDFVAFTVRGNVFFNNYFSLCALGVLGVACIVVLGRMFVHRKWWKSPAFFVIIALLGMGVPVASNIVMVISPDVTYHLLMRYQWVLFPVFAVALVERYAGEDNVAAWMQWGAVIGALVLLMNYVITDNIAYSNLQKKYEKTYAYCLRLLDRIEQTPGYYQGIPIAMVGVVGDEEFPLTDITGKVTNPMIGMNGDILLYTGSNYQEFMKNYLGATLNFLPVERMGEIYYSPEYTEMDSFPGENSVRILDGVLYVKTENSYRGE